ncbi:MAG: hypothetical protein NT062_36610, partial [Proteobacteria bacterium]|nr:hypothetical protein [Pseudomonadota bacterium]
SVPLFAPAANRVATSSNISFRPSTRGYAIAGRRRCSLLGSAPGERVLLRAKDGEGIKALKDLKAKLESIVQLKDRIELDYNEKKDPRLLTIVFSRDNLQFAPGECVVDANRRQSLHETLAGIFPEVCAIVDSKRVQSISLEGHTDNSPVYGAKCGTVASSEDAYCFANPAVERCLRRSFENNVRLSAARAQFVFFEARDALRKDARIAECLDTNFSVAGRGPTEPLDGKDWRLTRAESENVRNRRVVIRVRVRAAEVTPGTKKPTP